MTSISTTKSAFGPKEEALRDMIEQKLWPYSLKAQPNAAYRRHHHASDETLYLLEGSLVFEDVAAKKDFRVSPHDKLFIPAGTIHAVRTEEEKATYLMGLKDLIFLEDFVIWEEQDGLQELNQLNKKIGEAELSRNPDFLQEYLDKDLRFRRANGAVVDRQTYLQDLSLAENTYEFIHSEDMEVLTYLDDTALISLRVWAKGTRSEKRFEGMYRNTRLFVKQQGKWRCALWFNTPAETV